MNDILDIYACSIKSICIYAYGKKYCYDYPNWSFKYNKFCYTSRQGDIKCADKMGPMIGNSKLHFWGSKKKTLF